MIDPTFNPLIATQELIVLMTARLEGYHAEDITLSRDDALLALSLIQCMKELLEHRAGRPLMH
jgi:hypothetical protein